MEPRVVYVPTVSRRSWLTVVEFGAPLLSGHRTTDDPLAVRHTVDRIARFQKVPREVRHSEADLAGVLGWWVEPVGGAQGTMLYLHGGGYIAGSPWTHRGLVGHLVHASGMRAFVPAYRLAPEHRFPAALDDARAVYDALAATAGPAGVVLAGDSAGGGLAVALMIDRRDAGAVMPPRAVLLSPWVDLAGLTDGLAVSRIDTDLVMRPSQIRAAAEAYAAGCLEHPLVSPLGADLGGLPPVMIQVGSAELLGVQGELLAERAALAGTPVTIEVWERMQHVFQTVPVLAESRPAIGRLGAFCVSGRSAG